MVRAYNQQAHEIERFSQANREYVRRNRVLIRLQGLFFPSMTLFLGFGSLLVLWIGSQHVIRGEITLGEFVAFNAYLVMLSWPMIAFGWVTNILQRGMASWKRMLEVLDAVPDIDDRHVTEAGRTAPLTGAIEVRDLVFTYPGTDRPVLDHVSLTIAAGQTVALVGATGSGKSTLIHLIPRLHDPPPGPSSSTAWTCVRSRSTACAAPSASCRRSRSCSRTRSAENVSLGQRAAAQARHPVIWCPAPA